MKWKEVASELGVTDRTLRTYRKCSDFPEGGSVEEMRGWMLDRQAGLVGVPSGFESMTDSEAVTAKRRADAKLTSEKALIAELDRKEREGELVRASDVASERQRAAVILQNQLLGLPGETRQRIESGDDAGQVEAWLQSRLRELINSACDKGQGK